MYLNVYCISPFCLLVLANFILNKKYVIIFHLNSLINKDYTFIE